MPCQLLDTRSSTRCRRGVVAGLDLEPLDVCDGEQMAWLEPCCGQAKAIDLSYSAPPSR
jgi:hypothetical protein